MKLAFTLCSNNYLANARILAESFALHNADYVFVTGLVDRKHVDIDYSPFQHYNIIPIEEIGINDFETTWEKFDIVELNTAVKASFFKFLLRQYPTAEIIIYMDPDTMVFQAFHELEKILDRHAIVLTPHVLKPIPPDGLIPAESTFLNYGIFNLGFLALNRKFDAVTELLDWWEERCLLLGFNRPWDGLFVDQLWMNFAPVYFRDVYILKMLGYNMGPWNLHERKLVAGPDGKVRLANGEDLIFYHFSNYSYKKPGSVSRIYNRVSFDGNSLLKGLYDLYVQKLLNNDIGHFETIPCYFIEERLRRSLRRNKKTPSQKLVSFVKNLALNLSPHGLVSQYRKTKKPLA